MDSTLKIIGNSHNLLDIVIYQFDERGNERQKCCLYLIVEIRCPDTVDNGKIIGDCMREVGDKCEYQCETGFIKTQELVVCTKTGQYHAPKKGLCERTYHVNLNTKTIIVHFLFYFAYINFISDSQ